MSQWTQTATLQSNVGELTVVGYVDGPAFQQPLGIARVQRIQQVDVHGDVDALLAEAETHVGDSLREWNRFARSHPRPLRSGWVDSTIGVRRTRMDPSLGT